MISCRFSWVSLFDVHSAPGVPMLAGSMHLRRKTSPILPQESLLFPIVLYNWRIDFTMPKPPELLVWGCLPFLKKHGVSMRLSVISHVPPAICSQPQSFTSYYCDLPESYHSLDLMCSQPLSAYFSVHCFLIHVLAIHVALPFFDWMSECDILYILKYLPYLYTVCYC